MIMDIARKSYLSRVFENGSFQDVNCFDERRIYLAVLGLQFQCALLEAGHSCEQALVLWARTQGIILK